MWIKRKISEFLMQALSQRPSLILTGCRQTGKTSLLKHLLPDYTFVSLDVPRVADEAENSGEEFLKKHTSPVIIDEIQYAPQLLRYVKHAIDQDRNVNGRYCITGSQKFSMMQNVTESLAGRTAVVDLHTLSLSELEDWSGKSVQTQQLLEWTFMGGYPELHSKALDPERFYSDYLATYLERDVRQLIQVKNLRDFDRFMRLAAARTGQLLSMNSFASDIGVSPHTIRAWLSVLETSNVIYLLEPFYNNLGKRIVKAPKLYFLDTGLACYLTGFRSPQDLEASELRGAFFETLALGQIIRWYSQQGKKAQIYFFRDHAGHEVDFVIPIGEKLKLIECKWSERPDPSVPGFQEVIKQVGPQRVLSQTILAPVRTEGYKIGVGRISVQDCVRLDFLATP